MDVFYEAFCPDTFAYIEELWELYDAFRLNIDVTFYPFGKGNVRIINEQIFIDVNKQMPLMFCL